MTQSHNLSALEQAQAINTKRLAILVGFTLVMALVRMFAFPVPLGAFALFAFWTAASLSYQIGMRRITAFTPETMQAAALMLDVTLLTILYSTIGGGWWMGATVYIVVANAAFASLPKRLGRIVSIYAAIAFVAMIAEHTLSIGEYSHFLGVQTLEGHYAFGTVAAVFGSAMMLTGIYLQDSFVRHTRASREHYRLILATAPDMIVTVDQNGSVLTANEAAYVQSGRRRTDIVGHPFHRFIHPQDLQAVMGHAEATLSGESRQFEARYIGATDSVAWLSCTANPIRDDDVVTGFLLIGRDITETRRSIERLRASEALLARTQKLTRLGSWEWNIDEDVVHSSEEFDLIIGETSGLPLTAESVLGRVHSEDRDALRKAVVTARRTREPFGLDHRIVTPAGETRTVHTVGEIVTDEDGRPRSMIGSCHDVTEQTALTEQLRHAQKMEAVGRLAGGIAHDFNNILTAMRSYCNFLLEDLPENHDSRREAVGINKAVDHAATLTRQLLAFSRRQIMQPRVMNLNDTVRDVDQMLRRLLGADVQLATSLEPSLGMTSVDPGLIEQVLVNLAVNARDAMPSGGSLRIETANAALDDAYMKQHAAEPGEYVMIAMRDTGVGMDRATQARIFEPFFTTKENGKGTGLGLAMVYGIVKQSGGYVWVYSEPGQGTTFKVYLPRMEMVDSTPRAEALAFSSAAGSETILLVEDEESVREVSSRLLRRAGYTVLEAPDGRRALEICDAHAGGIDLLITDMVMPEMGGRELARRVRATRPEVPLVFMSGYTDDEDLRRSFLDSGSAFLEKPFTPELLLSKTRELLSSSTRPQPV
ncbi:MAG: PAS domain S-box protein [Gemmatimonadales bacterium]